MSDLRRIKCKEKGSADEQKVETLGTSEDTRGNRSYLWCVVRLVEGPRCRSSSTCHAIAVRTRTPLRVPAEARSVCLELRHAKSAILRVIGSLINLVD